MSAKGLLRKIKRVFGLGDGSDESPDESDAGVTIEREHGGTRTASGESTSVDATEPPTHDSEAESSGAETTTDSSTPDSTAATDDGSDTHVVDSSTTQAATDSPEAQTESEESGSAASAEPVDAIKGIGPTYSDRLSEAGIETVGQLAEADPETVADAAQTGETKAGNWIDRAGNRQS